MLMSLPNSVGIDSASANKDVFIAASGRLVLPQPGKMSEEGGPFNSLHARKRSVRLMSLPNSVGIDPASANEDVLKASGRLVLPHQVK